MRNEVMLMIKKVCLGVGTLNNNSAAVSTEQEGFKSFKQYKGRSQNHTETPGHRFQICDS